MQLDQTEQGIAEARRDLDGWLTDSYRGREDQKYFGENDASYPRWDKIESLVGRVFDLRSVAKLTPSAIDSVLFFISRSDECGRILAWLNTGAGSAFSNCGDLVYEDLIFLAERVVDRADDFCDYQIVACLRKCDVLDKRAIDLLHRIFQKSDSYTRRMVVDVFAQFGSEDTLPFATKLWQTDDCEFAKLTCLHALKGVVGVEDEFQRFLEEYQETFDVAAEDYRQSHLEQLSKAAAT